MTERTKLQADRSERGFALEQYLPELHRYLMRCLRRSQDSEDLLQDVYVRFLQSPHKELVRQPRPYLYRIAANVVAEFNLQRKRRPLTYDSDAALDQLETIGADEVAEAAADDERERLERMLMQLPKLHRTVLLLKVRDGLTHEEIAHRLGITHATARTYLSRALAQCRAEHCKR